MRTPSDKMPREESDNAQKGNFRTLNWEQSNLQVEQLGTSLGTFEWLGAGRLGASLYEDRNQSNQDWDPLFSDSCWPEFLTLHYFFLFLSLNCPFVSGVVVVLNSSVSLIPLLVHAEHWTLSRENFDSYALCPNFLQWKVNLAESFCQHVFFRVPVTINYLKKQLVGKAFYEAKPPL